MNTYDVKKLKDIRIICESAERSDDQIIVLRFLADINRYKYTKLNSEIYRFIQEMNRFKKSFCIEASLPNHFTAKDISKIYCSLSISKEYALIDVSLSKIYICSDIFIVNSLFGVNKKQNRELKNDTVTEAVSLLTLHGYIDDGIREIFDTIRYRKNKNYENTLDFCFEINSVNKYTVFALDNFDKITSSISGKDFIFQWYILVNPSVFRCQVDNSRIGWEKAWLFIKKINKELFIDLSVKIPADKSNELSDITNLKYMFPLLDTLCNRCFVHIEYEDLTDEQYRFNAFLRLSEKYMNRILLNGSTLRIEKGVSDIFPLMSVDYNYYFDLKLPYDSQKLLYIDGRMSDLSDIINDYYKWLGDESKYIGTVQFSLSAETKRRIRDDLINRLNEESSKMSSFSFMMLIFLVRNLVEQKVLIDIDRMTYNSEIFDKLCADADGYAEGLYQIIENACLYSHGHRAYFCMRLHKTDKEASLGGGKFEREAQTRVRLYNKYQHIIEKNIFNVSEYKYFLEFSVIDESTEPAADTVTGEILGHGIVQCFNNNNKIPDSHRINSIKNIIEMTESEYKSKIPDVSQYDGEFYWKHYGLRWFSRIVAKNDGVVFVLSPDEQGAYVYPDGEFSLPYLEGGVFSTEYSIVLPISYEWNMRALSSGSVDVKELFDISYLNLIGTSKAQVRQCFIDYQRIAELTNEFDMIDSINDDLMNCKTYGNGDCIYLDSVNCDFRHVEILAKAIFKYIYKKRQNTDVNNYLPINIAVNFGTKKKCVSEFARIFTIFYEKIGKNEYMDNVQIALCSDSDVYEGKGVCFLIAGKNIASSYETANVFVYYNSENTLDYIPLLKYLTSESPKEDSEPISQYPFDLVLNNTGKDNLFIERMKCALNTDISENNYGCKIENTHVRISSRIHLGTFYEAELLFHNIGNVYRFAYLTASDIIKEMNNKIPQNILITGYELYSAVFVQQIQSLIVRFFKNKSGNETETNVYVSLISTSDEGVEKIKYISQKPSLDSAESINVYTVIPIGTTMSTIYKLHNLVVDNFPDIKKENMFFCGNYSMIAVGHSLLSESGSDSNNTDETETVDLYWKDIDTVNKIIKVREEKRKDGCGICVKYYLAADSEWQKAEECKWCKTSSGQDPEFKYYRPLIQVDRTSTLPGAIFNLKRKSGETFINSNYEKVNIPLTGEVPDRISSERRKLYNKTRLLNLKPNINSVFSERSNTAIQPIIFSHICNGNNHYQFYFDFLKLTERCRDDIISWAKKQAPSIPPNSFNVLLSPLEINNSSFLKIIIDNVFSSSLRFLHIDISGTYKEDARVKFKYIAEEFKRIRQYNRSAEINFYYVDDSIVTGQTLMRGRMLMRMLLDESGIEYGNISVFRKLFFLVNRNSFDTINNYVDNPRENLHSYMTIFIPSYNTTNDLCPACKISKQYELLRKRSVSVEIADEFDRLAKKHIKRSPDGYNKWLEKKIKTSHSYFAWLRIWLYGHPEEDRFSDLRESLVKYMQNHIMLDDDNTNLENISQTTLEDYFAKSDIDDATKQKQCINLMKYIVAERAYLRLETLNDAYYHLIFSEEAVNRRNDVKTTYYAILKLISDGCSGIDNEYDKMERIISYIKVISREHLSSYYHIRCAIMKVMLDILNCLLTPEYDQAKDKEGFRQIVDTIRRRPVPYHQYTLFNTIIHRLSLMQFSYVYDSEKIEELIELRAYERLVEKWHNLKNGGRELTEIPTKKTALNKFIISVKTATMLTKDDAACFNLIEQSKKLQEYNKKNYDKK